MAKSGGETPLMKQHQAIKAKYPDAILLFRVGDFYETFGQDAVHAARVLGITLTKRNNGSASAMELAGFPHHALDTYLHKLVKAGFRVAVCDQLEDPKTVKGIVKRGVTELVTPGVAINEKLLEHHRNNFLASIHLEKETYGIAFLDISTGEFLMAEGDREYADKLLQNLRPSEIILSRALLPSFRDAHGSDLFTYPLDEWIFQQSYAEEQLLRQFSTHSLKGFGVDSMNLGIVAAGAILHYLRETEHPHLGHITSIQPIRRNEHLWMDRFTIRNLELIATNENAQTLYTVLNNTQTPMGARLLRRWMLMPLVEIHPIQQRLNAVEYLLNETTIRESISTYLKQTGDVERLCARIPLRKLNPRDLVMLATGLEQADAIKQTLASCSDPLITALRNALDHCPDIHKRIKNTIQENPPALVQKGGVIAPGVDPQLDDLRQLASGGKNVLVEIQQREILSTGIPSLKISYNNVFGYYLEVTNIHKSKVPDSWIRKQTLANAERYITPELKEYEEKILGAEEKIQQLELQLFQQLTDALMDVVPTFQQNARILATLDCLSSFAQTAALCHYHKPTVHTGTALSLQNSRHPVIERHLPTGESYIQNDIALDTHDCQIIILTGPNMSGKSAILRQTALITLMAHMGCFVPATSASIPLTDRIFTRVGASDNLSGGESTFMVEMNETASILNNLSDRSLVILDEIGRGTSTYDGISIAWSIAEYLHDSPHKPKTLFATHYHELNELENRLARVQNFHITNKESGNKIIFLRKLAAGGSTHSFGIHVARMAGMPPELIQRAHELLSSLEKQRDNQGIQAQSMAEQMPASTPKIQLNIFDAHTATFEDIRNTLNQVDINRLTPVEALLKLEEIKNKLG